eukprot:scaffold748_cov251-Pinguiococcus_pyrenoidosus.AAC.44
MITGGLRKELGGEKAKKEEERDGEGFPPIVSVREPRPADAPKEGGAATIEETSPLLHVDEQTKYMSRRDSRKAEYKLSSKFLPHVGPHRLSETLHEHPFVASRTCTARQQTSVSALEGGGRWDRTHKTGVDAWAIHGQKDGQNTDKTRTKHESLDAMANQRN